MHSRKRLPTLSLLSALTLAGAGCSSPTGTAARQSPADRPAAGHSRDTPPTRPLDPATLGDVSGVVRLAGKPPAPLRIDTSMDPACALRGGTVFTEQYALKGDRLANVYVYVKSFSGPLPPAAPHQPVVIDQKGCLYTPHVVAVQVGQPVEFRNSDPTMHNIHTMPAAAGNTPLDLSQGPSGKPQTTSFTTPEAMMPLRCNNHPWMNAFLNVSATPWFAVTAPDGLFELTGLPAGDYVIAAVHEKLGEQQFKLTVKPRTAAQADFTFAIKEPHHDTAGD
ncbi:MAG: hypothetical protein M3O02_02670 [Acidobacteriota bacterium]|nr:hypothetical protein [Acidobacteriota bacterium]